MHRDEWMEQVLTSDLTQDAKARLIGWYDRLGTHVPERHRRVTVETPPRIAARSAERKVAEDWTALARALCETLEQRAESWRRRQRFRELREDPALEDDDFARLQARRLAGEVSRRRLS